MSLSKRRATARLALEAVLSGPEGMVALDAAATGREPEAPVDVRKFVDEVASKAAGRSDCTWEDLVEEWLVMELTVKFSERSERR